MNTTMRFSRMSLGTLSRMPHLRFSLRFIGVLLLLTSVLLGGTVARAQVGGTTQSGKKGTRRAGTTTTKEPGFAETLAIGFAWNVVHYAWLVGAMIVFYLLSVLISFSSIGRAYPPVWARLGCWGAATLWLFFVTLVYFPVVVASALPLWLVILIILIALSFGIAVYLRRPVAK